MTVVDTHLEHDVAVITLNNPDRRNVLSPEMVSGIIAAFDHLETETDCSVVIVTGAPPAFCAGADLAHLGDARKEGLLEIYAGFLRVANSPLPTIAAVNGPAVGAGMNLALACDVRIVGESGRFDPRFTRLGIHPGGGHTWLMRQLVGPQTAAAMVLFSEVIGGHDAVRLGLAWQCVPDDELLARATELAQRTAQSPSALLKRVKSTIGDMARIDNLADAVEHELVAQLWSMTDPELQRRLAAMRSQISSKPGKASS